jgi:CheY-like chemotaxis protein
VFCDIGLPAMDGYQVARAMREDPHLKDVALIALTGYASPEDAAKASDAGFDAHVAKPTSIESLERVLRDLRHRGVTYSASGTPASGLSSGSGAPSGM